MATKYLVDMKVVTGDLLLIQSALGNTDLQSTTIYT